MNPIPYTLEEKMEALTQYRYVDVFRKSILAPLHLLSSEEIDELRTYLRTSLASALLKDPTVKRYYNHQYRCERVIQIAALILLFISLIGIGLSLQGVISPQSPSQYKALLITGALLFGSGTLAILAALATIKWADLHLSEALTALPFSH